MARTPRERARDQTIREITSIGRAQLASKGAAELSLRAVARDLGVVSSAVYRYVKSRDELLTLLVIDGYNDLGSAAEQAVAAVGGTDYREQFCALARAVRSWALGEPATYALLFGSPVPGYQAPAERTTEPGTRVIVLLVGIIEQAYRERVLAVPEGLAVPDGAVHTFNAVHRFNAELSADLAAIRAERNLSAPDELLARGVLVWSSLFGAVSFEVFGQYGPGTFTDPAQLFEHHLAVLTQLLGFSSADR